MAQSRLPQSDTLADILERVLETGIVVAGDIRVNLNDVELLTIQIRLIVCSVDKAQEMGMDWWKDASYLNAGHGQRLADGGESEAAASESSEGAAAEQLAALNERLAHMERRLDELSETGGDEADAAADGSADPAAE